MLNMSVARELGYTLSELNKCISFEELILWSIYFDIYNDEQAASIKKSRYRQNKEKIETTKWLLLQ